MNGGIITVRKLRLSLLTVVLVAALASQCFGWKFVAMGDSRARGTGVNEEVLPKIVDQINKEHVDLVIFAGDAVNGTSIDSVLVTQFSNWLKVMNRLNCPYYYSPGNHEIITKRSQGILAKMVNQPLNGPPSDLEMVYSFNHKNAHFVSLNSNHYGQPNRVQSSWLEEDLSKNKEPHVFVFAHEPAYPSGPHKGSSLDARPAARDHFWHIMERYGVGMYFCGHEHLFDRTKHGSVIQVITGACGAPVARGGQGTISKQNYVVVDVEGNKVSCETKGLDGKVLDSWSYEVKPQQTGVSAATATSPKSP